MVRMESTSYSGEFVLVLFNDGSNSSEEGYLSKKIGVYRFTFFCLSFQLFFERVHGHRYEFIVS